MPETQETFTRPLAHSLTDDEALERYERAQEIDDEADELQRQLKEESKDKKDQIKKLREDAKRIRTAGHDRSELRLVECRTEVRGWETVVVRIDTQEVIDRRVDDGEQSAFPGLAKDADQLPLEPDYSPNPNAPKAPTEKKPRKGKGGKGKKR